MKTGRVVGRVWATKRLSELPSGALLEIDLDPSAGGGTGERVIAFDPLGCLEDERVLVTQGSVARSWFANPSAVIDALVIGSIDEEPDSGSAGSGKTKARK
ncbi:MAG: EutN/CcmL family microcompartment protein [Alphaproteobacteria bacterium]|nr:EutN/CcmL family microcompartment protein [Alphaproteobacteria bacterium]